MSDVSMVWGGVGWTGQQCEPSTTKDRCEAMLKYFSSQGSTLRQRGASNERARKSSLGDKAIYKSQKGTKSQKLTHDPRWHITGTLWK